MNWQAIPPASTHMGGIWEAAVKSAKSLLKRTFGQTSLTPDQLRTAFCEIEAILNSRPLAPQSEEETELLTLTPSMLVTGFRHRIFPVLPGRKPAELAVSKHPIQRYRYLKSMIAEFWARWRDEYLAILHTRQKFHKKTPNIRVGELVLISDDNCPPSQWPLGRISHVYPGKDGLVRAVTVFLPKRDPSTVQW